METIFICYVPSDELIDGRVREFRNRLEGLSKRSSESDPDPPQGQHLLSHGPASRGVERSALELSVVGNTDCPPGADPDAWLKATAHSANYIILLWSDQYD